MQNTRIVSIRHQNNTRVHITMLTRQLSAKDGVNTKWAYRPGVFSLGVNMDLGSIPPKLFRMRL